MNQGKYLHQINEHNPFNINIQFNINSRRAVDQQQAKDKKISIDATLPKNNLCNCHPIKTPEAAQTDRNTYNKDLEYLQPMDDPRQKRRSKRNSMDINTIGKSSHVYNQVYPKTSKQKSLNQTQLFKKPQPSKKKRSYSKYEGEVLKKGLWQGASKSAAIEVRSGKKTHYNHSLKNIIHKIVNSQLSKRSLGTSFSKGKSPYHLHVSQNAGNSTNRKKQKKKSLTCKSDRDIKVDHSMRDNAMVEKLNSLKSMTASVLRSEIEEPVIPYYSKNRERIHIVTENSYDFIDEIAYYEKKARQDKRKQRRQVADPATLQNTTDLIEGYIKLLEINQIEESAVEDHQRMTDILEGQDDINLSLPSEKDHSRREERRQIRDLISQEMNDLFEEEKHEKNIDVPFSNKFVEEQETKRDREDIQAEKIKPFMSSEIIRGGGLSQQLERIKLQQLKKQQIQKWAYLLEFIKKNMGSQEADTQTVLNEVYSFLERSKNDLQRDLAHDNISGQKHSKQLDEQFTVKMSENRQERSNNQQYYHESAEMIQDEDVASFKEQYATEQNQDMKMLNLETISSALKHRKDNLMNKKQKQLAALELRKEASKLSEQQFQKEKEKILKWTKHELEEISKARKSIWKGFRQARGILDKNIYSRQYEEQSTAGKMMKCLSETYLKKPSVDYAQALRQHEKKKINADESESYESQSVHTSQMDDNIDFDKAQLSDKSEDMKYQDDFENDQNSDENIQATPPLGGSQQLQLQKSQQMQAIKERLLKMKYEHFSGDPEQGISYEEVQRQLEDNYSDEEIAILNKEMGTPQKDFNNIQTKLKYCCAEDKEDIFQFIFLDLCIELYQEPCHENKIMKAINSYVTKAQAQAKKKKGVKTNLNVVKQYLKRFSSFLLRTNKTCLNNLCNPMGPSALQMLRYMHDGDYQIKEEEQQLPTFIIPVQIFEKFQQNLLPTLQFQQYYDDSEKQEARVGFLKTILHIHNRALFDSLNEHMDHERPYGIWGAPFPWKKAPNFTRSFTEDQLQEKLKKGTNKVVEQCSYVCGLLVDKQESLVGNAKVSEAYVDQIRQDRLSRMLANELVESEERWLFYDDQETEVLVELGNFVWTALMQEFRTQVSGIVKNEMINN